MIPCYPPTFDGSDLLTAPFPVGNKSDFESAFAARVGARFSLAFAYGRSSFFAALKALGFRDAEVILPAFTCPTMAGAIMTSGNYPVFVDIDPADYTMDLTAVARAVSGRTRAVVVTHLYGYCAGVEKVREILPDDRITIVEDCAHRLPPGPGSSVGLMGDVGIFSLGRAKAACAVRGGVVATNSSELYEKIKAHREQGSNRLSARAEARLWLWWLASYVVFRKRIYGLWQRHRGAAARPVYESFWTSVDRFHTGDSLAFTNFQARLGLGQLARLDAMVARRRELAQRYDQELRAVPEVRAAPLLNDATYTFYNIRVPGRDQRRFEERMRANGVMVGRTFDFILPDLEPYRHLARGSYPEARQAASQVINLPIHPRLGDADVRRIVQCVRRSLDSARSSDACEHRRQPSG